MKTILAILLPCLFLFGCSRKENFTFDGGVTMQVQHRQGDALEGIHLAMKADGEAWKFDAKKGKITDEPNGMVSIVLYDVQADLGTKGRVHREHTTFTFHKIDSRDTINNNVTTNLPQFTIAAADLAVPAVISTNSVGAWHDIIFIIHLQFTAGKADEFRKFTREHIHQQTQLLVGSKVVAKPYVVAEVSGGQVELSFPSIDQAQPVADSLNEK